jgi:hypothetical protein
VIRSDDKNRNILRFLLEQHDRPLRDESCTLLHDAVAKDNIEAVELLLQHLPELVTRTRGTAAAAEAGVTAKRHGVLHCSLLKLVPFHESCYSWCPT